MQQLPPPSYFLKLVEAANYTGNKSLSNAMFPAKDQNVIFKQNVIGWTYFSTANVKMILKELDTTLSEITQPMLKFYYGTIEHNYVNVDEVDKIFATVKKGNDYVVEIVARQRKALDIGQQRYHAFMKKPNDSVRLPLQNNTRSHETEITQRTC